MSYRHRIGRSYNAPQNGLGYTENFLYMLDNLGEEEYRPHPKLARALDVLFILHVGKWEGASMVHATTYALLFPCA